MQAEDVFRTANDRIADKGRELGWRDAIPFVCECSDARCFARIELTLAAYEDVRAHPQRYLVVPGHEIAGAFLIDHGDRAILVEKLWQEA
jgi:hypothetical protein